MTPDDERRDFLDLLALAPGAQVLEAAATGLDAPDASCDGILCIDGISRVSDRAETLAAWGRALKPGGRLLYTDPAIVAGLVTCEEAAALGGLGVFVLAPQGENEALIEAAGFRLLRADDATDALAQGAVGAGGRHDRAATRHVEVARRLASERRLVRIAFLLEKLA